MRVVRSSLRPSGRRRQEGPPEDRGHLLGLRRVLHCRREDHIASGTDGGPGMRGVRQGVRQLRQGMREVPRGRAHEALRQGVPRMCQGVPRDGRDDRQREGLTRRGKNVSHPEEYDVVVLGSGRARFFAWSLASQGKRVAVIERRNLAGSCPTIACAPSKNVIHGAKVVNYFRRGAEFGIAAGDWKVEMPAVRDRKRKMVDDIVALNVNAYQESGAELVKGHGRFVGPRTIEVTVDDGRRTLRGEIVVICTGSRARIDPIPGLAESRPMTHIEALELDRVPEHLLVLGGGYVGLELAQAFRRFGSRVTVVERNPALIHREAPEVSDAMAQLFADEGIAVSTGTVLERVSGTSGAAV